MASHVPTRLSVGEKLHVILISLPLAIGSFIYNYARRAIAAWSNGSLNGTMLKRNLATCTASLLPIFGPREMQFLQRGTTGDAVRAYAQANKLALRSVPLTDADTDGFAPATLHLLELRGEGKPSSKEDEAAILLYFHGGAYITPLSSPGPARIIADRMGARRLAVLEYGLAPACRYPTQLAQAAAALRYVLDVDGGTHENTNTVVIAGDSAGANMALALLAHMQSPHPRIRPIRLLSD